MPSSRRSDRNEARDTRLLLERLSAYRCPVLWCNKPFIDAEARDRHVAVVHPKFPPPDELGSE